jgi:hypothetical protein
MTDIINDDEKAKKLINDLFLVLDMKDTFKKSNIVWDDWKDNMISIIEKKKFNENDIREIIEYFDFVIENPYYAKILKIENEENKKIIVKDNDKDNDNNKLKSYRRAIEIKKLILNYFIKSNKFDDEKAKIICNVNNINRWLLEKPKIVAVAAGTPPPGAASVPASAVVSVPQQSLTFNQVKKKEEENNLWRKKIIKLINMEKEERKENGLEEVKKLLDPKGKWRNKGNNPTNDLLSNEDKASMTFLTNLLDDGKKVQIDPIKGNSPSSGKSIFEEKECVEIAEYANQFCVKFTGNKCDTKSNEVAEGGRKRKSRIKRKKSRKYLRRKRRRESRRKELKRIRKSKKKLV